MEDSEVSQAMGPQFRYVDHGQGLYALEVQMETMLKARELWGLVDGKDVKPSEGEVWGSSTYTKRES
jgi:hypothetical protein